MIVEEFHRCKVVEDYKFEIIYSEVENNTKFNTCKCLECGEFFEMEEIVENFINKANIIIKVKEIKNND